MLSSDKSNIFVSMKVHLASVYEKILSSVGVTFSRGLILKSIVCGVCVMFSSDVSCGTETMFNDDEEEIPTYSVVLLGDSKVGKTQILNRKKTGEFDKNIICTIGVDFRVLEVPIKQDKSNQNIKLKVFDTSGQEKFESVIKHYVQQAYAVVLVYDITDKRSFEHIGNWLNMANKNAPEDAVYFLVGNKTDLDDERKVSTEKAKQYANDNDMRFFEVSAMNGENIDNLFAAIGQACAEKYVNDLTNDKLKNEILIKNEVTDTLEKNYFKKQTHSKNKRCSCCPCNKEKGEDI